MGIGTPFTIAATGTRHMLDTNVTFGRSSERYNARDDYRNRYTDGQRTAAGIGTAFGVALPVAGGLGWATRGFKVPGGPAAAVALAPNSGLKARIAAALTGPTAYKLAGRATGTALLGVAAGVGVKKSFDIATDDGHFGAVGGAGGAIAGAAAGIAASRKLSGRAAAMSATVGGVVGGVAGFYGGKQVDKGDGFIGKEHVKAPNTDVDLGDRAASFASGAFNHFNEVGPTTQGMSFGYQWGLQEQVREGYSNSERSGAMHGDLLAAGILGGGALAVAGGLMGTVGAKPGDSRVKVAAEMATKRVNHGFVPNVLQRIGGKSPLGIGAAAAGIAGVVAMKEFDRSMDANGSKVASGLYAGGALAATAGTAAMVSKSGAVSHLAAAPKAASSALAAAVLIGVMSTARLPLQQFMNDAKDSVAADGGIDWAKAAAPAGVGAVGGRLGAVKVLNKLIPAGGIGKLPKGAIVAAGTAATAAAGGGIGLGLSSTMPDDLKTRALTAGGGLAAGLATARFAKGISYPAGAIGGVALGMSASALAKQDPQVLVDPPRAQDVAGSAT